MGVEVRPATGGWDDFASFMVPRGEFEVIDTWDTAGMRGSGSPGAFTLLRET